jgi:complex iron-sulfur molybdoenzyme family reductase subunit alpha
VVLPAVSWFEMWNLNTTDLHSYIIPFTPVIPPQFESRTDWQIWRSLAQAIQDAASARGFTGFTDDFAPFGAPGNPPLHRDFTKLALDFATLNTGGMDLSNDRDAAQFILDNADETRGMTLAGNPRLASDSELATLPDSSIIKHPKRFTATSEAWTTTLKPGVAYYGFQRMFEEQKPLATMVGAVVLADRNRVTILSDSGSLFSIPARNEAIVKADAHANR